MCEYAVHSDIVLQHHQQYYRQKYNENIYCLKKSNIFNSVFRCFSLHSTIYSISSRFSTCLFVQWLAGLFNLLFFFFSRPYFHFYSSLGFCIQLVWLKVSSLLQFLMFNKLMSMAYASFKM